MTARHLVTTMILICMTAVTIAVLNIDGGTVGIHLASANDNLFINPAAENQGSSGPFLLLMLGILLIVLYRIFNTQLSFSIGESS